MTASARDTTQLREGAELIAYEVRMMKGASARWQRTPDTRGEQLDRRIYTDVFLLHVRNLLDFLVPRDAARDTDVLARHYVSGWGSSESVHVAGRPVRVLREQIDKLLSHVTYERKELIRQLKEETPRWPVPDIENDVLVCLGDFWKMLPDEQREWFGL